jgi:RNA polymerase sigma factor (sigma-70 family)
VPLVGGYSSISETPDDQEIQFLGKERRILLDDLLSRLRTREREILSKRFGSEPQTLQDVGHTMGLTRERIRQIEKKSLKRLRTMLRKQSYADWHVERPNG